MSTSARDVFEATIDHLSHKSRVLFLTTSNRWAGEKGGDIPKSTQLAIEMKRRLGEDRAQLIDVPVLNIANCEGNVSTNRGNTCGTKEAVLVDAEKNPSGCHRCWASINNPDDELWKISKPLLESDAVIFFGSVRWGQANAYYQKLIERLTWIENRHSTLGEDNIVKDIEAGCIFVGQNWNGTFVLATQKQVLSFYGFKTPDVLSWNWQYSEDAEDEDPSTYTDGVADFAKTFLS